MSMPPPVPYTAENTPKKKNWFVIGCGGCLGLIVLLALIGGAIAFTAMKAIQKSDAYAQALSQVQESPQVQEKIGTPMTPGKMVLGAISTENDRGTAGFGFQMTGPKGGAKVAYAGEKSGGVWTAKTLTAIIDGTNEVIELVKQPEPSSEAAPVEPTTPVEAPAPAPAQ